MNTATTIVEQRLLYNISRTWYGMPGKIYDEVAKRTGASLASYDIILNFAYSMTFAT